MTIRIYTSKDCTPCEEVERQVREGKLGLDIELVDIETDEGFYKFKEEVLKLGDGAVPSAYKEGKQCIIGYDDEKNLVIDCPIDAPPASDEE